MAQSERNSHSNMVFGIAIRQMIFGLSSFVCLYLKTSMFKKDLIEHLLEDQQKIIFQTILD